MNMRILKWKVSKGKVKISKIRNNQSVMEVNGTVISKIIQRFYDISYLPVMSVPVQYYTPVQNDGSKVRPVKTRLPVK